MSDAPKFAEPFTVAEMLARFYDGFYTAASLNLGEPLADGSRLEQPDPMEAWLAIMAYGTLLVEMEPLLSESYQRTYRAGLADLTKRFAERHADVQVPLPSWAMPAEPAPYDPGPPASSIAELAKAAWAEAPENPAGPAARPSAVDLPARRPSRG